MESKFLKDSLFGGMKSNAFKLGTVLTLGWFWFRPSGCHIIYRGQDGQIDYDNIQAVMGLDDDQVTISNQDLPAGTIWHYVRRQASGCGLESGDSPACIVKIDSAGDMIAAAPNKPLDLTLEQLADGKVKLQWRYTRTNEEISPTGFRIYIDSGSGFDFDNPVDAVLYGFGGNDEFEWTSNELADGQQYRFCVRSYTEGAGETINTDYASIVIDATGPDAIQNLFYDIKEF